MWGWLKHRYEELRRPVEVLDSEGNTVDVDQTDIIQLPEDVYTRPWGGIPLIYSFGDCKQLSPVLMSAIYDKKLEELAPQTTLADWQWQSS